jgi:hypothetical protein
MADIKDQLIKDSYNYVLQSDLGTGVVYRIGGDIPVNPIFQSGLTINSGFTYSNGTEQLGYVMTCDAFGNANWAPASAATPSSGVTSITVGNGLSANTSTGAVTIVFTGSTGTSGDYLPLSGGTLTGGVIFQNGLTANTISATTYFNLPVSGLTSGTGIQVSGSNGNYTISFTGSTGTSGDYLPLSGGTVTGGTIFTNGLTANTISATTYYNLPVTEDTFVTGFSLNNNVITLTQNRLDQYSSFTISLSAYTGSTGISGAYLPLSGGTLTGGLVANSGVTASTISQTSYIDFNTGTTNPSQSGGRVFFDNDSKALSYYDVDNDLLPIAMGQQLYIRAYNDSGVQIDKGKVITITGTSNSLPSAILAVNNHSLGSPRPIGVSAENIPNGTEGLVIVNGILSGITLNTFANGDILYLSDTIPGGYVNSTSSLAFSARTNEIGYVLQTGTTTGKIYVNINNEDSNLTLTDIERNILEGNVISSGVYEYTGMAQGTGATINVAQARGWIVKNTYEFATLPDVINLYYSGGTNIPITNLATADATFILINSASTLVQQITFPTPQERRENIFLGKVVHPSRTSITSLNQTVDFDVSPMAAIRDLWTPLKLINQGIIVSPHSTTLEINTSAGILWGNGIGWITNQQNPDSIFISGTSPTTFQYRTRLGPLTGGSVTTGNTTTINPGYYDLNGVVTAVGGGSNSSTNQRVFLFPTGLVRIQLGQTVYSSLAAAVAGSQTEQFVEYSLNRENAILIGIISVNKNATNLSLAAQAVFNFVSKFGEILGGTGGLSTTTLQQAYDNSATPEIVTNSSEGALTIQNGTGAADNVTNLFEGKGLSSGALSGTTSFIRADGLISGSSVSAPTISATTVSATTYQNLPTDIRTTGGTYSNNTFTFTNNTGGTYSVLFNTVTGLTVNGNLSVTGNTSLEGLTATTISATTYQNLPVSAVTFGTGLSGNTTTGAVTLQLSASSYSMFVNNTASAAAPSQVTYKDTGDASFSSNITWTSTPSPNTGNYRYRWTQIGNTVLFYFSWTIVAGGGAGNSPITITLPNDMPQPAIPTGFNTASYALQRFPFHGNNAAGGTGVTNIFNVASLQRNTANTAYDLVFAGSVTALRWFSITGQYFI